VRMKEQRRDPSGLGDAVDELLHRLLGERKV
jgi:hypothetical protein